MNRQLLKYVDAKKALLSYFKCADDYHVRVCAGFKWQVTHDDGMSILSYWQNGAQPTDAVVAKKDGCPLIFKTADLTMVIAIDCIKTAFIMNNNDEIMA